MAENPIPAPLTIWAVMTIPHINDFDTPEQVESLWLTQELCEQEVDRLVRYHGRKEWYSQEMIVNDAPVLNGISTGEVWVALAQYAEEENKNVR